MYTVRNIFICIFIISLYSFFVFSQSLSFYWINFPFSAVCYAILVENFIVQSANDCAHQMWFNLFHSLLFRSLFVFHCHKNLLSFVFVGIRRGFSVRIEGVVNLFFGYFTGIRAFISCMKTNKMLSFL